jgi:2-polyprenyl-6-methoxyphenol hydroxylase-like FAD-dependent oxidoreductase
MSEQILVAGAGPVGMTMAAALKRLGVDVRIVDKSAARTDKSKALVLWPRTLELMDIQGCLQGFLDAGMEGKGARILADGHELVHVSLDIARSRYRFTLLIPQNETERLLEEELQRRGVTVERQVELQSFADDGAGVTAKLLHADGTVETARFSYLAGCDGAHSAVRHGLGSKFEGVTEPSDWALADIRLNGEVAQDELTICWQPDGILALFPIVGGRFRVIGDMGPASAEVAPPLTLADVQKLLDDRAPPGLQAYDPFWLSRFRINERKVKDYRKGRAFLAGDAAHIHSPAGGQGMNTGMQDAFNLAWKLALVCHGRAKESLLDSYSPERSAIGDQVLHNAGQMTRVALIRNPILQGIRNAAAGALGHLPAFRQRLVDQLTEVDLHYEKGPLTGQGHGASHSPANGHRAQDIMLNAGPGGRARLHEMLHEGKFALLSVGAPSVALPEDLGAVAAAATAADADANYAAGHHYLIRPDGYVALSTGAATVEPIIDFLRKIAVA